MKPIIAPWSQPSKSEPSVHKLVIALCRAPLEEEEPEGIEYQKHSLGQYYQVEEVLAMVDIASDERDEKQSLFNNELLQINHVS